ncbi:alpha-ketoglutarate-dependent dioxygenase AlkB family protein [Undibacterium sp. Ren11W]|uniref:alpha-ketoglutarate-dependent dioxygenase AlkB family protein n=1 Tax=Undibacterium sp. Ren11W TaxID=3413045 RepID=UPI003BF22B5E
MSTSLSLFEQSGNLESIVLPDAELGFAQHFYAPAMADDLFGQLLQQTAWQHESILVWGKSHLQPRLTAWYADPGTRYSYSGITLQAKLWTPTLLDIKHAITRATGHEYNSVLLNLYRDQQDSMGWHSDDEPELGRNPVIASLSLGATRGFKLKHKTLKSQKTLTLDLINGSLLLMAGAMQHHWQHAVAKQSQAIGPRINLTFRQILPQ